MRTASGESGVRPWRRASRITCGRCPSCCTISWFRPRPIWTASGARSEKGRLPRPVRVPGSGSRFNGVLPVRGVWQCGERIDGGGWKRQRLRSR